MKPAHEEFSMKTRTRRPSRGGGRAGFTLLEVMIATTITLLLMGLVVQIFAMVGDTVAETRSTIQMIDRLRAARQTVQSDLAGFTFAGHVPPLDPERGLGYIEIVEGPIGSRLFPSAAPMLMANGTAWSLASATPPGDATLGDIDDMLMLTTTTQDDPFVGRYQFHDPVTGLNSSTTTTSDVAEVCYFMRGTTLYRRSLLVKPGINVFTNMGFYGDNDISVRLEGGPYDYSPNPANPGVPRPGILVGNSLGDLTKRQNRYGHQPFAFPYDARFWGPLGLPTLRECSFFLGTPGVAGAGTWPFPLFDPVNFPTVWGQAQSYGFAGSLIFPFPPVAYQTSGSTVPNLPLPGFPQMPQINLTLTQGGVFDAWPRESSTGTGLPNQNGFQTPYPWDQTTYPLNQTGQPVNSWAPNTDPNGAIYGFSASNIPTAVQPSSNSRFAEDVILTNVLSFDVKVWDPAAPIVGNPGLDGSFGVAGYDDDQNGTADDISELGAAGSDDIVWQPGDVYPDAMLPAALQGLSNYNYSSPLATTPANWANTQYLAALQIATANGWIIQQGAYVDLAYAQNPAVVSGGFARPAGSLFCGPGDFRSQLWAGGWFGNTSPIFLVMPAVYDTGSVSYEDDGLDEDAVVTAAYNLAYGTSYGSFGPDQGTNGTDDNTCAGPDDYGGEPFVDTNNNGMYDAGVGGNPGEGYTDLNGNGQYDPPEKEMPPPYRAKLGGVQIKIRAFDPDSRQIREVTIVQEFENE